MNIFLFNKSLRCFDNTTLIHQIKEEKSVIPIFIMTEQVNKKKNKYFSDNSVQFMIESIKELYKNIKYKYNGKLYLFESDNFINVFKIIIKYQKINSIGTNYDYSPYAKKRQTIIKSFCEKNKIKLYILEDHTLYKLTDKSILKDNGEPYTVFTPFRNNCMKKLHVPLPDKFKDFKFNIEPLLSKIKYNIKFKEIDKFYRFNPYINVNGGRTNGLKILKNYQSFNDYSKQRDFLTYNTTFLAAHNHFGTVSIREVYKTFKRNKGIINELHWRDFYYSLYHHFPHMLEGQIGKNNKPFKLKFDKINWKNNNELFIKWIKGELGIPICDAAMRQLNKTGFMHNRLRMITAGVVTKLLLINWRYAEKYFAQHLVDYDCIQNSGGWAWTCTGVDPKQIFRIFSPSIQSSKFDPETKFIKQYIPELNSVPSKSIHNWESDYIKFPQVNYPQPQIDYKKARLEGLKEFSRVSKLKD